MSNLSNLYISQSYFGVVNLENSLAGLPAGNTQLQDGVGENLGIILNSGSNTITLDRNVIVSDNLTVNGTANFSGSITHTGSLDVLGDITASGNIKATIGNFDTVNTRVLHVTEESASVIFSSGSNVIGDDITDIQSITGQTKISGSTTISGSITNKQSVSSEAFKIIAATGQELVDVSASNPSNKVITLQDSVFLYKSGSTPLMEIKQEGGTPKSSTWRVSGITFPSGAYGDIQQVQTATSAGTKEFAFGDSANIGNISGLTSEDGRAGIYFGAQFNFDADFIIGKDKTNNRTIIGGTNTTYISSSVDIQTNLTANGDISSSTLNGVGNVTIYSASVDNRLDNLSSSVEQLEDFTGSLVTNFLTSASFNAYTQSTDNRLNNIEIITASIEVEQNVQNNALSNLEATTASLQTEIDGLSILTGSYATTGSNVFDGAQVITGSVNGNVETISIASLTASIDCSQGNFFKVSLPSGATQLQATNITQGQTISLRVTSQAGATMTHNDSIKYPLGLEYSPSLTGSYDLVTFVSFDNTELLGAGLNTFNI